MRILGLGKKRRVGRIAVVLALLAAVVGVFIGPAAAVHDLQFQLDGNTKVDPPTSLGGNSQAYDWESFFKGDGTGQNNITAGAALPALSNCTGGILAGTQSCGFIARGWAQYTPGVGGDWQFPDNTTFASGSKDTLNIAPNPGSGWQCASANNLLAKDDLVNVYTVAYRNPANSHLIVYFGAEKSSNTGDNNIGIWFLQDPTVGCTPGKGNTDFKGQHVPGDILLTAAFTNGGGTATVQAFPWLAGTDNGGVGSLGAPQSGVLCGASLGDSACAITNDAANNPPDGTINPPWNHPTKVVGTGGGLASEEFYEGGLDVTQLEINAGNANAFPCISTFVADTRASQQPSANLFDYAEGSLPACNPSTTMKATTATAAPATIHSGDSSTYTFYEKNNGNTPLTTPSISVTKSAAVGGACTPTLVGGDTNSNGVLDPGEQFVYSCTVTNITANLTITATGHGTDPLGRDVTFCTTGSSTQLCNPDEQTSASVTVIHPNTDLTATPATASPTVIHAGATVTLTFYEKNSGDGVLTSPSVSTNDPGGCATTTQVTSGGFNTGDTNTNGSFDPGETWVFSCTTTDITSVGPNTITATGDAVDSLGAHVTFPAYPSEQTTVSVTVIAPNTSLNETAVAAITYTFKEQNTGSAGGQLTNPSITVPAGECDSAPAQTLSGGFNVGDTNHNGVLDVGETWTWTCTHTLTGPSTDTGTVSETNTGVGHGTDQTGVDITTPTYPHETDSVTVNITNNAQG